MDNKKRGKRMIPVLYFIFLNIIALIFFIYAIRHILFGTVALFTKVRPGKNTKFENITILIPCHNEEKVIINTLNKWKRTKYPKKVKILVINDCSTDDTEKIVRAYIKSHKNIRIINTPKVKHSTKARGLNYVLPFVKTKWFAIFDADYHAHKDCLTQLGRCFDSKKVICVQGTAIPRNYKYNFITRIVNLERHASFFANFVARDKLKLISQWGGTTSLFRTDLVRKLGGFNASSLTEDTDFTILSYQNGYKIRYTPLAMASEESVETLSAYFIQRRRWCMGHTKVFLNYLKSFMKSNNLPHMKVEMVFFGLCYALPSLIFVSNLLILGVLFFNPLIILEQPIFIFLSLFYIVLFYAGNFAPFYEISMGLGKSGKFFENIIFAPFIIIFYILGWWLSTESMLRLIFKKNLVWDKTERSGK